MSVHDFYVLSPYLAMAGAAVLVILLDLVLPKKSLLPYFALASLAGPFVLSLIQFYDLAGATSLLHGADAFSTEEPSILLGTISVDRFALFFNFLVIACAALVVMSSTDYVRNMERFQGEYFGLILFAATGMMLLAAATELITIYVSLELTTLPMAALTAFLLTKNSSEAGMKFLIIGAVSSALMLYGMALVFGFTGSTQLTEISTAI
ncbi:MAG: proton-conducting transporter membrane subunit, partial [Chloroflexota bacterium]|nr:proton-conducting transporter membrane subunit [Chloroflexota bacterium]